MLKPQWPTADAMKLKNATEGERCDSQKHRRWHAVELDVQHEGKHEPQSVTMKTYFQSVCGTRSALREVDALALGYPDL